MSSQYRSVRALVLPVIHVWLGKEKLLKVFCVRLCRLDVTGIRNEQRLGVDFCAMYMESDMFR